jgi:hypothetical protein
MNRQLQIITCQPNDFYFVWQLRVQLHNFRKHGYSDKANILVYNHNQRRDGETFKELWDGLQEDYPEAKFFFYDDPTGGLHKAMGTYNYIPLLRPWLLARHFAEFPELKEDAILYIDSDVVFTKYLDFQPFLEDDISYLSDTRSYISAEYFDSKIKDVLPDKLEDYKKIDVLKESTRLFGITREIAVANQDGSGGAQYLLKNIDAKFWEDVFIGCIRVITYLRYINRMYFESEDKGFQSWCADMWSVLWNIWKRGIETKCPKEMDFAWATDPIGKWEEVYLYHDAGASSRPIREGHRLFHKRELPYVNNERTPFEDDLSFVSPQYSSKKYVQEIQEANEAKYAIDNMRSNLISQP